MPLADASHSDAVGYRLESIDGVHQLVVELSSGTTTGLADPEELAGFNGSPESPSCVLLAHNGLHVEIAIDREHPVGAAHPAGVNDVVLESAVTTIQDCEDSVSAVDAQDKRLVYANWLGLMKGDLEVEFQKGGESVTRRLNPDRSYTAPGGGTVTLPGRSLLLVRNVGIHMYTDAVTTASGDPIPEC